MQRVRRVFKFTPGRSTPTTKFFVFLSMVLNLLIYYSAGVAAPLFFRNLADRRQAAFLAGGLFSLTAMRALRLSISRPYARPIKIFFGDLLLIEFAFWVWRLFDVRPLGEVMIFGISASFIHPLMSGLYLISCAVLFYAEWHWMRLSLARQ